LNQSHLMKHQINLVNLENVPILQQLRLEEALLRADDQNWCIINSGSSPSIVMGISGKKEQLVDMRVIKSAPIPIIRRYSGGGTVIVDKDTIFVSFILRKDIFSFECFPEPIHQWSAELYKSALNIDCFTLKENDYVISNKKCGGNAQYFKKDRFVHHTSFLWNFCNEKMKYLKNPSVAPKYRNKRSHTDFLCRLKDFLPSKKQFINQVSQFLGSRFDVVNKSNEMLNSFTCSQHRKSTEII